MTMRKFGNLWTCEWIKTIKKKSTIVLILLAIASLLLTVGITKLVAFSTGVIEEFASNEQWKEELTRQVEEQKRQLQSTEHTYDAESYANLKAQMETNELALKYTINNYNYIYADWKNSLLDTIQQEKTNLYILEETQTEAIQQKQESIQKMITLIEKNDYTAYMDTEIAKLKEQYANKEITKEEYEETLEIKELEKQYEIGKEGSKSAQWKTEIVNEIQTLKESIRTGIDQNTMKVLSAEKVAEMEETITMDRYRLEHNLAPTESIENYKTFYHYMAPSMAMLMVAILAIILAGSSISSEISKGTIKFWLMLPAKRWKILLAKLCNIVMFVVLLTIVLSFISYGIGNLFFEGDNEPYLYVQDGKVNVIGAPVYNLLRFLTYDIDIFIYILLAMMLSVMARNTALAVGLTTSCYAGAGLVMQILNSLISSDWIKYIPFNNMSLTDKIFANAVSYNTMQMSSTALNNVPISFSLCVLGVCAILMIMTMFDSLNKRDVV